MTTMPPWRVCSHRSKRTICHPSVRECSKFASLCLDRQWGVNMEACRKNDFPPWPFLLRLHTAHHTSQKDGINLGAIKYTLYTPGGLIWALYFSLSFLTFFLLPSIHMMPYSTFCFPICCRHEMQALWGIYCSFDFTLVLVWDSSYSETAGRPIECCWDDLTLLPSTFFLEWVLTPIFSPQGARGFVVEVPFLSQLSGSFQAPSSHESLFISFFYDWMRKYEIDMEIILRRSWIIASPWSVAIKEQRGTDVS